jgi:hypothetical protein
MTGRGNLRKDTWDPQEAAIRGLDFFVRNQVTSTDSADHGRFPFIFDCRQQVTQSLTTNWTTGVVVEALLAGHGFTGRDVYLQAAQRAVCYLKSLQDFWPLSRRTFGLLHEATPQTTWAHPRDALTGAWAMLDYGDQVGDEDSLRRAEYFAQWFIDVGMEHGYPYWTARFDDSPWEPSWTGSFHSGGAFFFYRLFARTGDQKYRQAMRTILRHYNAHHLAADGEITVILDRTTLEALDGRVDPSSAHPGWQVMHKYNDDFGALANLAAFSLDGEAAYRDAAVGFLKRMAAEQRQDGGFGPKDHSVPSAGASVLIELLAARKLGIEVADQDVLDRTAAYLRSRQVCRPDSPADGAFLGYSRKGYTVSDYEANTRTGAYAIMALLRYVGASDPFYFFADA